MHDFLKVSAIYFIKCLQALLLFCVFSDLDENRLEFAKSLGADMTFKITSRDAKEVAALINREFGQVDKTIECTGAESSVQTAVYVRFLLTIS